VQLQLHQPAHMQLGVRFQGGGWGAGSFKAGQLHLDIGQGLRKTKLCPERCQLMQIEFTRHEQRPKLMEFKNMHPLQLFAALTQKQQSSTAQGEGGGGESRKN